MKLKDQVCSLELAKRLNELGVKQESYFWWVKKIFANDPPVDPWIVLDCQDTHALENISAFTVAELGEMLPIDGIYCKTFLNPDKERFYQIIYNGGKWTEAERIEADTRARMLCYLIEQGLIDVKKVK